MKKIMCVVATIAISGCFQTPNTIDMRADMEAAASAPNCSGLRQNMEKALAENNKKKSDQAMLYPGLAAGTVAGLIIPGGQLISVATTMNSANAAMRTPELEYQAAYDEYKRRGCKPNIKFGT